MKKIFLSWRDVQKQTAEICRQITLSDWRPEYVVGITRGGLTPANLLRGNKPRGLRTRG